MDVAREYGISSGLISTWRRALLAAQPTSGGGLAQFARVEIARPQRTAPSINPAMRAEPPPRPVSLIEIVLPDGTAVRGDAQVDPVPFRPGLAARAGCSRCHTAVAVGV